MMDETAKEYRNLVKITSEGKVHMLAIKMSAMGHKKVIKKLSKLRDQMIQIFYKPTLTVKELKESLGQHI